MFLNDILDEADDLLLIGHIASTAVATYGTSGARDSFLAQICQSDVGGALG